MTAGHCALRDNNANVTKFNDFNLHKLPLAIPSYNLIMDKAIAKTGTARKRISRVFFSLHYRSNPINHTHVSILNWFYAVLEFYKQPLIKIRSRERVLMNNEILQFLY